jgi:hypothetical protein
MDDGLNALWIKLFLFFQAIFNMRNVHAQSLR